MTDEEKNIFGNQLRERRNELNLTTQKVALDAEVGESTYKRLEAGDGNPRLDTLVRIAKCLKTDLNSVVPQEHLCKDSGIWQIVRKLLSIFAAGLMVIPYGCPIYNPLPISHSLESSI